MYGKENYDEMPVKNRSQKVMEAKLAFSDKANNIEDDRIRHPFWLLRMMTAGMLFLILVIAFYNDFSYHGFNKEYVEKLLADDKYWSELVRQVGAFVNNIIGQLR